MFFLVFLLEIVFRIFITPRLIHINQNTIILNKIVYNNNIYLLYYNRFPYLNIY